MTIATYISLGAVAVAGVIASMRWLRIAQREHYLGGSTTKFAIRWWQSRFRDLAAVFLAYAAVVFSPRYPLIALFAAAVVTFLPEGLSLRGRTSKLRWTRRLKTVAITHYLFCAVFVAIGALAYGRVGALSVAGLVAIAQPIILDGVLFLLAPVEKQLGNKYVLAAKDKLARVKPTVVAITGSYGKTSTKGYVAHLLGGRYQVLASPQSYNNQAGLTKTVNELLTPGTDVVVAEMGAYGNGEIASLCAWLPPTIAVITAIGPVHLERFKTLDQTLLAKSEIAKNAQCVVLNVDDGRLSDFAERLIARGQQVVGCSATDTAADVALIATHDGVDVFIHQELVTHLPRGDMGGVALTNVACAVGVATALHCLAPEIAERLSSLPVADHRLQARSGASGALILDDTFNSNPAGTRLALERLLEIATPGSRRVVVTPGMVELGPLQFDENAEFAERATEVVTDIIIVGRTNRRALERGALAGRKRSSATIHELDTREHAVQLVASEFGSGDVILYENDLPDHFP